MNYLSKLLLASTLSVTTLLASPYSLDNSHTEVGFSVKHLMITNVKGEFKDFKGDIDFDNKTKTFKKFKGIISTTSVDTGIEKRDNHLRSADFFLAEKYPNIVFEMTSYKADGDEGVMVGNLTIRGITKAVEMEVEDLGTIVDFQGNNRVGFTLKGKINRMDFDLKWNKALELGGVAVSETIKLNAEIEAVETK
jgi:polyisoprenoid-binding protein YceI